MKYETGWDLCIPFISIVITIYLHLFSFFLSISHLHALFFYPLVHLSYQICVAWCLSGTDDRLDS